MKRKIKRSYFLIAGIFTLMLINSSCMMVSPSHLSGNHHNTESEMQMMRYSDHVCGQLIDLDEIYYSFQYQESSYYFHSEECMSQFKQDPEKYIPNQQNQDNKSGKKILFWGAGALMMGAMMALMFL